MSCMPNTHTPKTSQIELSIEREVVIDAPVEVVWRTITEPDQITQWFADRVEFDQRAGSEGTLTFDDHARKQLTIAAIVVERIEKPHRFSFRWNHPAGVHATTGNSVLVEFTLAAETSERTRLRVAETGLDDIDWPVDQKTAYVRDHLEGWEFHLGRLHQLFAAGATPSAR